MNKKQGVIDGALQKLRAAAHLYLGDVKFDRNKMGDMTYQDLVAKLRGNAEGHLETYGVGE